MRKAKTSNPLFLLDEIDKFLLIVALNMGSLTVLTLIRVRVNARRSNQYEAIGVTKLTKLLYELLTVFRRQMLDHVELDNRVVLLLRRMVEERLKAEGDVFPAVYRHCIFVIMRLDFQARHGCGELRQEQSAEPSA